MHATAHGMSCHDGCATDGLLQVLLGPVCVEERRAREQREFLRAWRVDSSQPASQPTASLSVSTSRTSELHRVGDGTFAWRDREGERARVFFASSSSILQPLSTSTSRMPWRFEGWKGSSLRASSPSEDSLYGVWTTSTREFLHELTGWHSTSKTSLHELTGWNSTLTEGGCVSIPSLRPCEAIA
jgi:hypothetical protein